jgi:hypothetical protein
MTRKICFTLVLIALTAPTFAQAPRGGGPPAAPLALEPGASQAEVDKSLLAAPAPLKAGATVIKWKADFSGYDTLRKGNNRLVCFDKSGLPGQLPFSVECTSIGNLARAQQNMKFESETDRAKRQAALTAAEKEGTRAKPEFGSVWYHVMGQSQEQARNHMTIAVPGATSQSLGLPDNAAQGGVWIMDAGTSTAHLMTPGE